MSLIPYASLLPNKFLVWRTSYCRGVGVVECRIRTSPCTLAQPTLTALLVECLPHGSQYSLYIRQHCYGITCSFELWVNCVQCSCWKPRKKFTKCLPGARKKPSVLWLRVYLILYLFIVCVCCLNKWER